MTAPWDVLTAVTERRLSIPEAMARLRVDYPRLVVAMLDVGHLMPAALFDGRAERRRVLVDYAGGRMPSADAARALGLRDYADLLVVLGYARMTPPRPTPEEVEAQAATFEVVWMAA